MSTPQPVLLKVYQYAFRLKAEGKSIDQIKSELRSYGFDDKSSFIIARNIDKSYTEIKTRERKKNSLQGLFWFAGGTALATLTHYNNLHNSSFPYLIATLALCLAGARFFTAFFNIK